MTTFNQLWLMQAYSDVDVVKGPKTKLTSGAVVV